MGFVGRSELIGYPRTEDFNFCPWPEMFIAMPTLDFWA
jgi:hypothetical protein